MIKIFNKKTNNLILIDESFPQVHFKPMHYQDENPYVLIELQDLNFHQHADSCEDCKAFSNALGTDSTDWHIEFLGIIKRLDLSALGIKYLDNQLSFIGSYYFSGSRIKLNIDTDTVETLQIRLKQFEQDEKYEGCSKILKKLNTIKNYNIQ
ncbi:MAG: hypothetical protein H0W73_19680 [Bacteroidetes bacterium]|nr:hypothetical protein [Bacteroidota bacterium]